jgi:predicted ATPase
MIQKVLFQNFKALRHVEVEFERLTAIVGPNASGKTSILEGMHYLSQLGKSAPASLFKGKRHPLLLYSRGGKAELILSCCGTEGGLRFCIVPPEHFPEDLLHPTALPFAPEGWTFSIEGKKPGSAKDEWGLDGVPEIARAFRPAEFLRLEVSRLAAPSYSSDTKPRMRNDGEGMASALAHMALNQPEDFQRLQHLLHRVIPAVNRVRFDKALIGKHEIVRPKKGALIKASEVVDLVGDAIVFDFQNAPDIPAHLVSEGTILVLGLLTSLIGPPRPKLVLLDDLDHGLHPRAQRELVSLLRTLLEQDPELQIVLTTHSPYLLDNLKPEEVRLTTLRDDGSAVCARLDEHPDFERWKEEMTSGEMWSLFGEKWAGDLHAEGAK